MELIKQGKLLVCIIMVTAGQLFAIDSKPVIFRSGKAEIKFEDHLHHEYYWWPSTLLSYPVVFEEKVSVEELILMDQKSGKQFPFQLTGLEKTADGKTKAILNLMADAPSGGSFDFVLKKGNPQVYPEISVKQKGQEVMIQTDQLSVWLPASQSSVTDFLPGPVLGISMNGKSRMGQSSFHPGEKKLKLLNSKIVNNGPLFAEAEVKYLFTDGSTYQAIIRCIKGYDFIEIKERMSGFSDNEKCDWKIDWSSFSPTHRQAPNHPRIDNEPFSQFSKKTGFDRYPWEKIDQKMLNGHLGIIVSKDSTQIPFEIGTYGNYPAEKTLTSSVFWDEKSMQSVGIFMNNSSEWNDQEYPIWHVIGKLSVSFYYQNRQLSWKYPVANGTRSTALSCYNHQKDIDYMSGLEQKYQSQLHPSGFRYRVHMSQLSHNTFLQNRYGTIHLNKIKDWVLTYPDSLPLGPVIFKTGKLNSVSDLERNFLYSEFVIELPVSGTCQNSGYGPTNNRQFYGSWVDAFNRLLPVMSSIERERFTAMFLFHSYVAADEEYMPMRNMLSGHPNFLADVKSTSVMASFLFPRHPEAKVWEELFAKYVELNTHYHIRPEVKSWDATGGRWTENLGTYVWAFLKPSLRANYLLQNSFNGINHIANANTSILGSWLLNSLSAPYNGESLDFYRDENNKLANHHWGIVTKENGPRRVHPPQGAHAARRMPSASLWLLGQELKNYDPLLSENISFVSHPSDGEQEILDKNEDPFSIMYPDKNEDPGTPPDFKSGKFTGYGVILRAAVGAKDELSIHLQQIDNGPNYRWGIAADGGCGNIYFYAGGKSYSHNGKEDSGDRRVQDTDLITNFGVFKDGKFKSIGMNVLDRPMYDLGIGQFAEIVPAQKNPYSWPEYQGRSVMLLGSDYFIVYDDVHDNNIGGRLSWFTHPQEDLPEIVIIKAGGRGSASNNGKVDKTELFGKESKGVWYDGTGDFLTFVSHKKGYKVESTPYGGIITSAEGRKDYIFRNDTPVGVDEAGLVFNGTAGFIREKDADLQEWTLFHGTRIGNSHFEIRTTNPNAGISAIFSNEQNIRGQYSCQQASGIKFQWNPKIPDNMNLYLDGIKQPVTVDGSGLTANIPSGKHIWNLTVGAPDLSRPEINFTRNEKEKVLIAVQTVPGSNRYRFEYSTNGVSDWTTLKEQSSTSLLVRPAGDEGKGYVRVIALNEDHQSASSIVYPVYFTDARPHFPDGLKLATDSGKMVLTWGRVLGCNDYKLFRRVKGSGKFLLIYKGKECLFIDRSIAPKAIYEYAVRAVNGNGESEPCHVVDNNPYSWLNFDPKPGEPFRRSVSLWNETGNPRERSGIYYPE